MSDIKVTPIPLYKNVSGRNPFESQDPVFKEYRRRWCEQPLNFEAGAFPLFIDIEVTNACNLRCTFCATTYLGPEIKRELIKPEWVYKILEDGRVNGLYGVKFNDRGEPLLHPDIIDFVRYAKQSGLIDVYFNTNAMLLTQDKIEGLIDAGLDRISISVEGFDSMFYESYRINGKFDLLVKNVRNLWETRQKKRAKKPFIRIQSVILPQVKEILHEYLDGYKRFWGPYADEISAIEYKEESSSSTRKTYFVYPWACHQLWQRMVVWCDGNILPCNEDIIGSLSLGNICSMGIKDAWNSVSMVYLRNRHKKGIAHILPACRSCPLRDTQIKKLMETGNKD